MVWTNAARSVSTSSEAQHAWEARVIERGRLCLASRHAWPPDESLRAAILSELRGLLAHLLRPDAGVPADDAENPTARAAREIVVRVTEWWLQPDEEILAELRVEVEKYARERGLPGPESHSRGPGRERPRLERGTRGDLLTWRLVVMRFSTPRMELPLEPELLEDLELVRRDPLCRSLLGAAVFGALVERSLVFPRTSDPRLRRLAQQIFGDAAPAVMQRLWRGAWLIVNMAEGYRRDEGPLVGYAFRMIRGKKGDAKSGVTNEYLNLHDNEVDLPTFTIEDRYRRWIDQIHHEVPAPAAADASGPVGLAELIDATRKGASHSADSREGGADDASWDVCLTEVLGAVSPKWAAAFVLSFLQLARWDAVCWEDFSHDYDLSPTAVAAFASERQRAEELAHVRIEACESKLGNLRRMRLLTEQSLAELLREARRHTEAQIETKLKAWERAASSRGLTELGRVQRRPEDREAFLVARYQELCKRIAKVEGYVRESEKEARIVIEPNRAPDKAVAELLGVSASQLGKWNGETIALVQRCLVQRRGQRAIER